MKVAISIGHGRRLSNGIEIFDPGAVWYTVSEYSICQDIGTMVQTLCLGIPGLDVYSVPRGTLQQKVQMINDLNPDCAIEIHLNASTNPAVRGCEALYYETSHRGQEIAERFSHLISETLHTMDRGPRPRNDLYFLTRTKCPAIITEAEFLSHPEVACELRDGLMRQKIAMGHVKALHELSTERREYALST